MKFKDFKYEKPDMELVLGTLDDLIKKIEEAESFEVQKSAYESYHQLMSDISTAETIVYIRNSIDTRDEFYSSENEFFNKYMPIIGDKITNIYKAMLNSKFSEQFKEVYGERLFVLMDNHIKGSDKSVISLMQEDNKLRSEYTKLYASAKIPFDGKILSVEQMVPYKGHPDREIRKAAFKAEGEFFDNNREQFDRIYDDMVKNRTEQAKILGYKDYVELGNTRMGRIGYGRNEVVKFRNQVVEDLVPAINEIKKYQKERNSIKDWKAYDDTKMFPDGNAAPKGTPEEILEAGRTMYKSLSEETVEFIDMMMEKDLFDVLSKEGKAGGGYCASIDNYKCPFIFSNFNGSAGDVDVLTHEAGHAFAAYTSYKNTNLIPEYRSPSAEACETHAMAMEFLTSDYHHLFFKEDTAKYHLQHAEKALSSIPYICLIDGFQYSAYENPHWTPEERNKEWQRLLNLYQPHLTDYEDIPFYNRGGGWQYKLHNYTVPMYYIDYALAQIVAFQFWLLHMKDKKEAWNKYMQFVKLAGTKSFDELVKAVGLKSPFEPGTVKEVVDSVMVWIRENQI